MIPKEVRVNMTPSQVQQYMYQYSMFQRYEERKQRLAVLEKCNVRIEVTKSTRKCYVNGRLVICLPSAKVCRHEFNIALRAVLDALYAVKEVQD